MLKAVVVCTALFPLGVFAKCGNSAIAVEGLITGYDTNSTVSVEVIPDANSEPKPQVTLGIDGHFHATIYFDRTEAGSGRENCSRKPQTVKLQLTRNGIVVDEVVLLIKRDFVNKSNTNYRIRKPITLSSK